MNNYEQEALESGKAFVDSKIFQNLFKGEFMKNQIGDFIKAEVIGKKFEWDTNIISFKDHYFEVKIGSEVYEFPYIAEEKNV